MSTPLRVAVIGCGYWGPNLVRNFCETEQATVAACCDLYPDRLRKIQKRYPGVRCTESVEDILRDTSIEAIAVATPVSTHYAIAKQALACGKHVLVEKPLADTSTRVRELIELAARARRVLMVDHTFVYSGAVRKMRELIDRGELGQILYFDSVRVNLGLFQSDSNVVWDLATHDISIMDFVLRREPQAVSAVGASHIGNHGTNMAYLAMTFSDSLLAHFHVNWLAPVKIRKTLVGGTSKMLVYDDLEPSEKIRVYEKGVTLSTPSDARDQALISYRVGDVLIPKLDTTEPLRRVCEEFVTAIAENRRPLTDGEAGYRVVRILEAVQASLDTGGKPVELKGCLEQLSPVDSLPVSTANR